MIIDGLEVKKDIREQADVAVVGSGAGGAVLAAELAERGHRVAVLEAGRAYTPGDFQGGSAEMTMRLYRFNGIVATLGRPGIALPYGQVLGGTTVINSGTCFRLPRKVIEHWRSEHGLEKLDAVELDTVFDRLEKILKVQPVDRSVMGRNAEIFERGAKALGYRGGVLRRNAEGCRGSGLCAFGCPARAKQSMDVSFIPRAREAGARFYTSCRAQIILTEAGKAVGLVGHFTDPTGEVCGPHKLEVRSKIVVLAAGAINTPYLLMRNRLCLGSPVGRNLAIHPAAKVYALFDEEVRGWEGIPQSYCVDEFADQGILFENIFVAPELTAVALPFFGAELGAIMKHYRHLAAFGLMVSDTSRGVIRKGLGEYGVPWYNLNRADTDKLKKGIAEACRIFFAAGAQKVFPTIQGIPEIGSERDIARIESARIKATQLELMAFHPLGTCRMGVDARSGVVDAQLECHQVKNLFIADGSVFPSSLGVNPQLSIMALAARAAATIHSRI